MSPKKNNNEEEDFHANVHNGGGGGSGSDGDEEEREDSFFQCLDRVPSGVHFDVDFPSDDDDEDDDDDVRVSFASAIGDHLREDQAELDDIEEEDASKYDYGLWMAAEPMSIQERRRRLLQGMGLASSKELGLRSRSSRKLPPDIPRCVSRRQQPPVITTGNDASKDVASTSPAPVVAALSHPLLKQQPAPVITRCRSDSCLTVRGRGGDSASVSGKPPPTFCRAYSAPPSQLVRHGSPIHKARDGASRDVAVVAAASASEEDGNGSEDGRMLGSICRIKNLDTGKEFVVSDFSKDGAWNVLSDLQTGMQLSLDEFDKFLGYTPIVKQLMRRSNGDAAACAVHRGGSGKGGAKHKKKGGWLKNIKFVASSVTGLILEKEKDGKSSSTSSAAAVAMAKSMSTSAAASSGSTGGGANSSERLKVHHYGKSCKELTGLYMCQEIRAHEGSIWCMKFSSDSRFLASAGEDRVVRVWQVLDCSAQQQQLQEPSCSLPPLPPGMTNGSSDEQRRSPAALALQPSKKTRRGKSGKQSLPEHIVVPETVFSLSGEPVCSFEGHLDDVLDLSWAKSQQLLSSSMDKTVRLWDMETKTCLKLFAHNDYVTCIQFNPVDDSYFISGSLDAKVRIWSIPERQVVDWSDLHEMVTATCYTPDGQGAIIGSHKGSCRFYKTSDCKLNQGAQVDIQTKKRKSQAKKISGFQFAPGNPSEVLVTSADSQIRVFDGVNMVHKFRGFKNTSSQISASYTSDGKYVVCASEDSHVYIWKRGATRGISSSTAAAATTIGVKITKGWTTTRSHEHFFCKDVSVAIPWPNSPSSDLEAAADSFPSCRSDCPPLVPKKQNAPCTDDVCSIPSHAKSESFASVTSTSLTHSGQLDSSASLSSSFSSWRHGNGSKSSSNPEASGNAWGLVVVTASLGGDIRVYQNFGLPLRIRGQGNLFY